MTRTQDSTQQKELQLSFLDQLPHIRVYGRYYIIFPFPDPSYTDAATGALRTGFQEVLAHFPYLAGTVSLTDISSSSSFKSNSQLRVLYPHPIDAETEAKRVFSTKIVDDPQLGYGVLKKRHFDPEEMKVEVFCPEMIRYHGGLDEGDAFAERMTSLSRGIPIPAFAVQVCFRQKISINVEIK
jgi:hypothetical protein